MADGSHLGTLPQDYQLVKENKSFGSLGIEESKSPTRKSGGVVGHPESSRDVASGPPVGSFLPEHYALGKVLDTVEPSGNSVCLLETLGKAEKHRPFRW